MAYWRFEGKWKVVLRFDIVTIFPEYFNSVFDFGIIRRARAAELIEVATHDLRLWTSDRHRTVDDRPFGGGDGMVLKPAPVFDAVESLTGARRRETLNAETRVVLMSAQGRRFRQSLAREFASQAQHIVIICGRYEGVDERVANWLVTDEISIGDYVLSGGEAAAAVFVDAVVRLVPGALGNENSAVNDSFTSDRFDAPHYTRPPDFEGLQVPEVLLGGNHAEIERWRKRHALLKMKRNRPDLLDTLKVTDEESSLLLEESNDSDATDG